MPCLPRGTPVNTAGWVLLERFRAVLGRDLWEQSVAERLARAAIFVVLLWLAIGWALS